MRTIQGSGAVGDLVRTIQATLTQQGFSTHGTDGIYAGNTVAAVKGFQAAQKIAPTGTVDDGTWASLMKTPLPTAAQRALQVTAAIEGHGYTLAEGNFDGALLTWGIVGFTMKGGELRTIVETVQQRSPASVAHAFGSKAQELLAILKDTPAHQTAWANAITVAGGHLAEPWLSMFAAFGADPVVQAVQLERVQSIYMQGAMATAKRYGLKSELGLALCFDIHVQNGSINKDAAKEIAAAGTQPEAALLKTIANAVANHCNPTWAEDVRKRKLMIATGSGLVHGRNYQLDNWGLNAQFNAVELA